MFITQNFAPTLPNWGLAFIGNIHCKFLNLTTLGERHASALAGLKPSCMTTSTTVAAVCNVNAMMQPCCHFLYYDEKKLYST